MQEFIQEELKAGIVLPLTEKVVLVPSVADEKLSPALGVGWTCPS